MEEDAGDNFGFEEGMSWLPAHILREACGDYSFNQEQLGRRGRYYQNQYHVNGSESHPLPPQWKSGRKYNNSRATRYGNGSNNGRVTAGGPGMQAVFLEPGPAHKSCGTGVFLPRARGAGSDFPPTKKPACSPVLLPSRVVQALNLNVQALGLHISPRQDQKANQKHKVDNGVDKKENEDVRDHFHVVSQDRTCSPEIFLPKEWSY